MQHLAPILVGVPRAHAYRAHFRSWLPAVVDTDDALCAAGATHRCLLSDGARAELPPTEVTAAATPSLAGLCLAELRLKLNDVTPLELPRGLAGELRTWLLHACLGARVSTLEASVRPGCTLLSVQAVLAPNTPGGSDSAAAVAAPGQGSAASLAAALLSGATGAFFRAQRFSVAVAGEVADVAGGAVLRVRAVPPPARLPPLRPLAVCSVADARVASAQPVHAVAHSRLLCQVHGQHLTLDDAAAQLTPGNPLIATLPACGVDGVALLQAVPLDGGDDAAVPAAPRPVLLCRDAAVAAEVSSLGDAVDAMPPGAAADAAAEAAERLIVAMGIALRGGVECPQRLATASLAAAMVNGWRATVAALLDRAPPKRTRRGKGVETALHAATRSGRPEMLQVVLTHPAFASGRLGHAGAPDADGVTPLHLAATLRAPGAAAAAVSALMERDACTPLAWFAARDARGATPAQLAAAMAWPGGEAAGASMAARLAAGRAVAAEACASASASLDLVVPELVWEAALERLAPEPGATAATARALLFAALRSEASQPSAESDNGEASEDEDEDSIAATLETATTPAHGALQRRMQALVTLAKCSVGWDEPSALEQEYVAYLARRNRPLVQILVALHLVQCVALCSRMLLVLQSGAPNNPSYSISAREGSGGVIDSHRLHNPRTGALVSGAELPLDTLRFGVWLFAPTVLLMRVPAALLVARYAFSSAPARRAVFDRRYEALLCLTCCIEALGTAIFETGLYLLFGVVVEYPLNVALLHVVFNVVVHLTGPVRPQWNWPMWVIKAATQGGFISLFPSLWRASWAYNSAVWLQQATSVLCVASAWHNDAALRAAWREEKRRALEAKKLA